MKTSDLFPESHQVDGNNVSKIANSPKPLEVERGHTFYTDESTGKRTDPPDYANDRD